MNIHWVSLIFHFNPQNQHRITVNTFKNLDQTYIDNNTAEDNNSHDRMGI